MSTSVSASPANPLSSLSLAILGLVAMQPLSGYDLRKLFASTPMGHFSSSPGAIYPALQRLERCGWLQVEAVEIGTEAPRGTRRYQLTEAGRQILIEVLERPITREDVIWRLDELMLRFSFMGALLAPAASLAFLAAMTAAADAYCEELRGQLAALADMPNLNGRLALAYGLESYLTVSRWSRLAHEQLSQASIS